LLKEIKCNRAAWSNYRLADRVLRPASFFTVDL